MDKKILDYYKQFSKTGELDQSGLCLLLRDTPYNRELFLFKPTKEDFDELCNDGLSKGWWASLLPNDSLEKMSAFTPMRQTILLFIAAMHNEL